MAEVATDGGAGSGAKTDWGRYGRGPLIVLALVAFIDSVDRGILPGVLDTVQDDLHFSDFEAGFLGTAFVLAGFVAVIPAGYLADRYRRTRIISIVLASWGAISALNAVVTSFVQFAAVRAVLGVGETVDNPASQSLIADYYRPELRGRAYAYQRVAPTVGQAVGLGVGGAVGALFGWRAAFLLVGVPGSLLAVVVWRMREPQRGEHDALVGPDVPALSTTRPEREAASVEPADPDHDRDDAGEGELSATRAVFRDGRRILAVPTLRYLVVGSAITAGALAGIGFWAKTFFVRHTTLTSGQASGVVAVLLLLGAVLGTVLGGMATDRLRGRVPGAPMVIAGVTQAVGSLFMMVVFVDVPLALRLVAALIGAMLLVAGFPALTAMTAEVVPAAIRGLTFSVTTFLSALVSAASPLLIGAIADQFHYVTPSGAVKGNLAYAFLMVTPLVLIGGLVVLRGRRHVEADTVRAAELARTIAAERAGA
ncbi:MAG TPA: MFS transporter [Acidimicrobiia bacterium]|nr:MFS transporter [Acidimicrobiia bacterium]